MMITWPFCPAGPDSRWSTLSTPRPHHAAWRYRNRLSQVGACVMYWVVMLSFGWQLLPLPLSILKFPPFLYILHSLSLSYFHYYIFIRLAFVLTVGCCHEVLNLTPTHFPIAEQLDCSLTEMWMSHALLPGEATKWQRIRTFNRWEGIGNRWKCPCLVAPPGDWIRPIDK